jgi:ABC-type transporter Mla subunit MlaD
MLIANLGEAAASIKAAGDTVVSLRSDAQGAVAELRRAAATSAQLIEQVSQLTKRVDLLLVQNQSELGRLISSLADTSMQLQGTAAQLRSDPAQIIWGNRRPERKIPDK